MHYLLIYELAADYLERRPEFRVEHCGALAGSPMDDSGR
jgi:hypothetical protein